MTNKTTIKCTECNHIFEIKLGEEIAICNNCSYIQDNKPVDYKKDVLRKSAPSCFIPGVNS